MRLTSRATDGKVLCRNGAGMLSMTFVLGCGEREKENEI